LSKAKGKPRRDDLVHRVTIPVTEPLEPAVMLGILAHVGSVDGIPFSIHTPISGGSLTITIGPRQFRLTAEDLIQAIHAETKEGGVR
jgi:hypothetical protein